MLNTISSPYSHCSWFGNLVASSSWRTEWICRALSSYIAYQMIESVYGISRSQLEIGVRSSTLSTLVTILGERHPSTLLNYNVDAIDPNTVYDTIADQKGFLFLSYLEKVVGSKKQFVKFLETSIQRFQYGVVDYQVWHIFFLSNFSKWIHKIRRNGKVSLNNTLKGT